MAEARRGRRTCRNSGFTAGIPMTAPIRGSTPITSIAMICGPMVLDSAGSGSRSNLDFDADLPPLLVARGSLRLLRHEYPTGRTPSYACTMGIDECASGGAVKIYPLPHMPVLKDLVPDLTTFSAQHAAVEPWLQTDSPTPEHEWRQSPEDRVELDGLYECILCACCTTACRSYWWNGDRFLGPAALLHAYRWLADSRDERTGDRLDTLEDPFGPVSLPHHHELRQCLPQGPQPGKGDRQDQEDDGRAARLRPFGRRWRVLSNCDFRVTGAVLWRGRACVLRFHGSCVGK